MNKGFIVCERTLSICCARVQQCLSEPSEAFYSIVREAVDFPLLEVFSLTSDRPLPGMNKIPCLETSKSAKWILEVPFSCTGVSV